MSQPPAPPSPPVAHSSFIGRLFKALRVRKLMLASMAVGVASGVLVPDVRHAVTRALIGWNAGVWLYLGLVAQMMVRADHGRITRTAFAHAEGAKVVLTVVVTAALISVVAVIYEVSAAKGGGARTAVPHLLFALLTVAGSWVLIPTLFTLNYASLFYVKPGGGLRFPEDDGGKEAFLPDYSDFAYFAFTIAVASQTSDVVIDRRPMRRLVLAQSILSFIFNTTILALTINLAAGLFEWSASRQNAVMTQQRVLSGMRPTGAMHLGHYHGALKNWVRLQADYECFYFVADWHALTTQYEDRDVIERYVYDMVIDWLAAGLDPERSTIFIQSRMPEHAELFTLLSFGTPLGWLERVPTYKDQMERLKDRDLATYGFLGYPLMQAADILIYKAAFVPVGGDQSSHVELTREVARRFNHLYGRPADFDTRVAAALAKLGKDDARYFERQRREYGEGGKPENLARGEAVVAKGRAAAGWTHDDEELLLGHLRGSGQTVLPEPQALHTEVTKLPGLDGTKMSKSYGNAIAMREEPAEVERKIKRMPTDPKRVHRSDPGNPEDCTVWEFHKVYSAASTKEWVVQGCTTAGIGCLDCKQPVIDAVIAQQKPWRERAEAYLGNPKQVQWIVEVGTERARTVARETMRDVRAAMGLNY